MSRRYRVACERVRRIREQREERRRREWPFPPNRFVRASELVFGDEEYLDSGGVDGDLPEIPPEVPVW